jgi:predicted ArsR family transcriptional regulator
MLRRMSQKLIRAVAQTTRLRVLESLKRTQGLCVKDIAARLGMSYMGVKEVCENLERRGLLDTWREPTTERRRPRMLYRLTDRAHGLFPTASNPLTLELLEAAKMLHGPAAPEKLLLLAWQRKGAALASRVAGSSPAVRAESLAGLRDAEGHMACVEPSPLRIIEHHCPFLDVLRVYPIVARLDAEMFQRVLGAPVRRSEYTASGQYRVEFEISAEAS